MAEHDPQNRQDDSFTHRGVGGPESAYTQVCDWLRANGINPAHVSGDARASVADGAVTLVMNVRGPNGSDVVNPEGTDFLKETKTFPATVPPPPLVEIWLAPKCPTCGR